MTSKKNGAFDGNTFEIVVGDIVAGALGNRIVPPGPERDRSGPERERYKERQKERMKGNAGDIIKKVPIPTKDGKIRVPTTGGYEPTWRPGRDGDGQGGPGPGEPGEDQGEYVEMSPEEFADFVLEDLDLPNMERKQIATAVVKSQKVKGIARHGPKARMNKRATAKARIRRVAALRNAQPELFVENFAEKCQQVFDAYHFYAVASDLSRPIFPGKLYAMIGENVEAFLSEIETIEPWQKLYFDDATAFRMEVREAVKAYLHANGEAAFAPYTVHEQLQQRIERYVYNKEREGEFLPSIEDVPFHKNDMRYNRLQDKFDPDSKAVVAFLQDRSGSMTGEPLALCKMYWFLLYLMLQRRYKDVTILYFSHDSVPYLWKNYAEFINIGASGGTVVASSLELVYKVLEFGAKSETTGNSAGPFPKTQYNRYFFHGTDGDLFDGAGVIQNGWKKLLVDAELNFCGYLETGTSWGGWSTRYSLGGQALQGLPSELKAKIGMAKVNRSDDVIKAFKEILTKTAND
jgi:uncharacterized sporulation protein YeaH/YhbH (DUF444 family)